MSAELERITIHTDIEYVRRPERQLLLDLRIPTDIEQPPLVIYIPMGGMRFCNKSECPWWLTEYGFAMASVEGRVSSEAIAPAAVHDYRAAIRWLRTQAPAFGYRADAFGAWGHSAGGLLASLLGTSGEAPELDDTQGSAGPSDVSCSIQAVVDECGAPHDLTLFTRPEIKQTYAPVDDNIAAYLGARVEERLELARLVSPSTYITAQAPPILLIHGDADEAVPVTDTIAFHEALCAAGVDASLIVLPGTGHGWDPTITRDRIVDFFTRTLSTRSD